MFSKEKFQELLETEFLGREFHLLPQSHSTNTDAWNFINQGANHGTVLLTDNQLCGRGRRNSTWLSQKNKSLTFSIILLPHFSGEELGLLPLRAGIGIIKAVRKQSILHPGLKWPNDIFINDKKLGGILIETKAVKNNILAVAGIGLNVNDEIHRYPEEFKHKSTSLLKESGNLFNRERLLADFLMEMEGLFSLAAEEIIQLWEANCIHRNTTVSFHQEDQNITGKFQGISSKGYAQILTNGEIVEFSSGILTL